MSRVTKISFFILFLLILVEPHFITGHVYSLPEEYAESIASLLVFGMAYGVYLLHRHEVRSRERHAHRLAEEVKVSQEKLMESLMYIGVVNRRLPLLSRLTSGLLAGAKDHRARKNVFAELLAVAVTSIVKADWGLFRFLERESGRTLKEFAYAARQSAAPFMHVSNKELIASRVQSGQVSEVGKYSVIATIDQETLVQAYLVFPKNAEKARGDEASVLQAIVDQAQLLYKYLFV